MYFEPGSRSLPDRADEWSCTHTFITLVDCSGLRGRFSHYYREGSLMPPCQVERENNSLCWKTRWARVRGQYEEAQAMVDELRAARASEQEQRDRVAVWRFKPVPSLPISPDFRTESTVEEDLADLNWESLLQKKTSK